MSRGLAYLVENKLVLGVGQNDGLRMIIPIFVILRGELSLLLRLSRQGRGYLSHTKLA